MIQLLGWLATIVVLGSYAWSIRARRLRIFNWGNALGFAPLALSEIAVGAWPAVVVTCVFGVLGVVGLIWGNE